MSVPARKAAAPDPAASATEAALIALWTRWRLGRDAAARNELIEFYMPHARAVAAMVYAQRVHDEVEFGDYLQLACVGLIEAVDRYDSMEGAPFKSYASHRIRGAILDELDRLSEKTQQIALRARLRRERLEDAKAIAHPKAEDAPKPAALTARGMENRMLAYLAEVGIGIALGVMLEGTGMWRDEVEPEANESLPSIAQVSYFRKSELQCLRDTLRELVNQLPADERTVVRYHYQQEISFEQVGIMMGVSRSRVSQLHQNALKRLRKAATRGPPCDVYM
jgi:RNA polymerase sigma factor for flagellar operon FliA